jgi:hypothetical protein
MLTGSGQVFNPSLAVVLAGGHFAALVMALVWLDNWADFPYTLLAVMVLFHVALVVLLEVLRFLVVHQMKETLALRALWGQEGWEMTTTHPQWGPVFGPKRYFERNAEPFGPTVVLTGREKTGTHKQPQVIKLTEDGLF